MGFKKHKNLIVSLNIEYFIFTAFTLTPHDDKFLTIHTSFSLYKLSTLTIFGDG